MICELGCAEDVMACSFGETIEEGPIPSVVETPHTVFGVRRRKVKKMDLSGLDCVPSRDIGYLECTERRIVISC